MPTLADKAKEQYVKLLGIGESGTGKTGSLTSLIKAGYEVKIIDYDNGYQPLLRFLTPEEQARVEIETYMQPIKVSGRGPILTGVPTAFARSLAQLDKWASKADRNTVIVLDSGTMQGSYAMMEALAANKQWQLGQPMPLNPRPRDWGHAMSEVEHVLEIIKAESTRCHFVYFFHIRFQEVPGTGGVDDKGNEIPADVVCYPSALGRQLPPKVGSYFNTMVRFRIKGTQRIISTVGDEMVACKVPAEVPASLPISTGLATIFKAITGVEPTKQPSKETSK